MKGRVSRYFSDKGYGFIKDENGDNRFFHISKVVGLGEISQGSLVDFQPDKNEKGLTCTDIKVLNDNKPVFIALGDTRIKLSNIKNYGVHYETINELISKEKVYLTTGEKVANRVGGVILGILSATDGGLLGGAVGASSVNWGDYYIKEIRKDIQYKILYITTYQGDNFRFHQKYVTFDIEEKIDELDRYFCS